jgi:hypothetical protein
MKNPALVNFQIQADGRISQICLKRGLKYLKDVIDHLRKLPNGPTSDKRDLAMVLIEGKGSCSVKHALLAQLAIENSVSDIKLALCTYNVSPRIHPETAPVLERYGLPSLPETRCFIKYQGGIYNLCGRQCAIYPDIVSEIEIAPMQTGTFKNRYHRHYIKNWLQIEKLNRQWSTDDIWKIREECMEAIEDQEDVDLQLLSCA